MTPPVIDWSTLLLLLRRRSGLTATRIGRAVGSDERHIARLWRGDVNEPRFGTGIRLLDLAADHLSPEDWAVVRRSSPIASAA
ncbi:MAG: hypothetical protein VBE63_18250 [Lamprobacter sp.]|uniref:hypothetical protein n=1 Tax=Lamprobacter sp. TaxID=3100796 RepID=UPI002B2601F4|nr:hypothetical protein [Lamprobacter sp.]MEA3641857.1 hypothetical protein [Lamprobacter sp.]